MQLEIGDPPPSPEAPSGSLKARAAAFCISVPHKERPFSRRDWGGPLHSLCSYQGKLKPSIAHFLISWFTEPGWRVLDPLAGVGTIPLEARRLGRIGIANDLSPLAECVSRAKLERLVIEDVHSTVSGLEKAIASDRPLKGLEDQTDVTFGLNGAIKDYFHPETLRELLIAREYLLETQRQRPDAAVAVVMSSLLHILHGNRPYAISRRSHPVTPLAPTGPFEYRPVIGRMRRRLARVLPLLSELNHSQPPGTSTRSDFRDLQLKEPVDAIVTSPPFARSLRFWTSNWMRLWLMGWERADFATPLPNYLELQQRLSFEPYRELAESMSRFLKPGGVLVLHLGETATVNMAEEIQPLIADRFDVKAVGRECVSGSESHGLRDKGATLAHWYIFARARC